MQINFGCSVGDILYIADVKYNKVLKFKVNCLKVFEDDFTAHGWLECAWASRNTPFNIPTEFSLKKLNKRVIFTDKKLAKEWLWRRKTNA